MAFIQGLAQEPTYFGLGQLQSFLSTELTKAATNIKSNVSLIGGFYSRIDTGTFFGLGQLQSFFSTELKKAATNIK